jgi:hypothetical protein
MSLILINFHIKVKAPFLARELSAWYQVVPSLRIMSWACVTTWVNLDARKQLVYDMYANKRI